MAFPLYTIGYASFSASEFIKCLRDYKVGAVVDVRSEPAISHFESYRYPQIKLLLHENRIYYLAMSQELGARPADKSLYTGNRADFAKIADTDAFKGACARIKNGLDKFPVCLMCAQKDPLNCHRSALISWRFGQMYPEIKIFHILGDGGVISQAELDRRALKECGLDQLPLSGKTGPELLADAYGSVEKEIAWTLE